MRALKQETPIESALGLSPHWLDIANQLNSKAARLKTVVSTIFRHLNSSWQGLPASRQGCRGLYVDNEIREKYYTTILLVFESFPMMSVIHFILIFKKITFSV